MTRYVLDTNVVSALRLPRREPKVAAWAERTPLGDLFVAAPTIAEIGLGVGALERKDPQAGARLRRWFETDVLDGFAGRVLPFDREAALVLANYRVPEHAPYDDALIAAIAQSNDMVVATRNVKHFEPLGVDVLNPWDQE